MSDIATSPETSAPAAGSRANARVGALLGCGAGGLMVLAGLLLWWREGDRLFTDGLIAAIARCF